MTLVMEDFSFFDKFMQSIVLGAYVGNKIGSHNRQRLCMHACMVVCVCVCVCVRERETERLFEAVILSSFKPKVCL
jgi:hypothetical protein